MPFEQFLLPVFLIVTGLSQCGVPIPRPVMIACGICGIIAGVLLIA